MAHAAYDLPAVPDPDMEVPKPVRDAFFKKMTSAAAERVRTSHRAPRPLPA